MCKNSCLQGFRDWGETQKNNCLKEHFGSLKKVPGIKGSGFTEVETRPVLVHLT